MKKKTKIILFIISSLVVLSIIFAFTDYFRAKNGKPPIFAIQVATYKDGGSRNYWGIGYKVIKCNTLAGDKSVHFGFYNINVDSVCNNIYIEEFTIVDETVACDMALEPIYEDQDYKYYFGCIKSHTVFIVFPNGERISVAEALAISSVNWGKLLVEKYPDIFYKEAQVYRFEEADLKNRNWDADEFAFRYEQQGDINVLPIKTRAEAFWMARDILIAEQREEMFPNVQVMLIEHDIKENLWRFEYWQPGYAGGSLGVLVNGNTGEIIMMWVGE